MNFPNLENRHYIMIVIGLVTLYLLNTCDTNDENFSVIPEFPFLPPKHWNSRRRTNWSPWTYYENEYHPAVPMVTQYDEANYRLPALTKDLVDMPMPPMPPMLPVPQEITDIDTTAENSMKANPEVIEKFVVKRKLNFNNLLLIVIFAIILFYILKTQNLL